LRRRCDAILSLPLHLHFPFLQTGPDRTAPDWTRPTTPQLNLTSPYLTSRQPATNKAIDTRTHTHIHTNEAEDAEEESIAQLYLYVMYVCMYTTRRMGVPVHE
jgi:hypothetical protein